MMLCNLFTVVNDALFLSHVLQCLGADILFDQLGFDVHQPVEAGHLDDISSLIVYHIVTGKFWRTSVC